MIGKGLCGVDAGAFYQVGEVGADDVVVNAPANVVGAGVATLAPPGVLVFFVVDEAEGIAVVAGEEIGQPLAFLWQEAAVFQVAFPVFQVFFGVGDVDVAAEDEALARLRPRLQPRREFGHEGFFFLLAFVAAGAGMHVKADDAVRGVHRFEVAPFAIDFRPADAVANRLRRVFQVQCDAAVSLLFGVVIVIVRERVVHGVVLELVFLRFGFLNADGVGILFGQPAEESLASCRTDAVGIEGYDFIHVF